MTVKALSCHAREQGIEYAYVTPFQGLGMWDATQTQGVALG